MDQFQPGFKPHFGDNFRVTVRAQGKDHFLNAFKMAFGSAPGSKAKHYLITTPAALGMRRDDGEDRGDLELDVPCFSILWHEEEHYKSIPLPYEMPWEVAAEMVWNWLAQVEYPEQPDHDGSNGKGFLLSTGDFWGHVGGVSYHILTVQPEWMWYGK